MALDAKFKELTIQQKYNKDTQSAYNNIAYSYYLMGKFNESIEHY